MKIWAIIQVILELWPIIMKIKDMGESAGVAIIKRNKDGKIVAVFEEQRSDEQSIQDTADRASRLNDTYR